MLDDVDRGLVHALHVDGRAPFARIAEVLEVSTQTVARRYHRLRAEAGLRVVGLADPHRAGGTQWLVRLTTSPATAGDIAHALAKRPDTSWVRLTSGGTEIVTIVSTPAGGSESPSLLLHDLPRTTSVTSVAAHCLLHSYLGGPSAWSGRTQFLSAEQQRRLQRRAPVEDTSATLTSPDAQPAPLTAGELRMLKVLAHDGRTGYNELAAATGLSPATVARQLAELRANGAIFFDVELDDSRLDIGTRALLWIAVAPAHLDAVGTTLARHPELAFVAATTGPTNLVAQALCANPTALHRYLTGPLATLQAIHTVETTPVLHTLKTAGPRTH